MRRGRWIVAAVVIALTGCEAGEPAPGRGPDPPVVTRAPIDGPSGPPGSGLGTPVPGFPTPAPTSPGSLRTPGAPASHRHATTQGICDDVGAGQALQVSTADPAGTGILDEWDACVRTDTTPDYTWLHNRTGAVWVLRTTPWAVVQEHRPARTRLGTVQSGVFHRAAEERGKQPNASAFIHPGESIWIATDPDGLSWQVDLPLTVAWAGAGEVIRRLDDHGQQFLTEAVTRRDSGRSVAVSCVLALADYARGRTDLHAADLEAVLREGFEYVLGDQACTVAARETIMGRRGRTISVLEDVLMVIPESETTMERLSGDLEPYVGITGPITLEPATPGSR